MLIRICIISVVQNVNIPKTFNFKKTVQEWPVKQLLTWKTGHARKDKT